MRKILQTQHFVCLQVGGVSKQHYHSSMNQHEWYRPSTAATGNNSSGHGSSGTEGGVDALNSSNGRLEARVGRSRIWKRILDHCFDNSDRRQYGMGITGRVYGRSLRSMRPLSNIQKHDVNQVSNFTISSVKCWVE